MKSIWLLAIAFIVCLSCAKKAGSDPEPAPKVDVPTVVEALAIVKTLDPQVRHHTRVQVVFDVQSQTTVTEMGVCFSTSTSPTITDKKVIVIGINTTNTDRFEALVNDLKVNVKYYFRAYAINKKGVAYGEEKTISTYFGYGEEYAGGLICYVDATKEHGFVVSMENVGASTFDNTLNYVPTKAYSTSDGKANTDKIIAALGMNGSAASLCRQYRGGGYSDWYLPAVNQLLTIAGRKNFLNDDQLKNAYNYWSSTEDSSYYSDAYCVNFGTGQYVKNWKTERFPVRAIRNF